MNQLQYTDIRHKLHHNAQVSGCEQYAHDCIVSHLSWLHPARQWHHVGTDAHGRAYGVMAVWEVAASMPTIAFRADIDALPVDETLPLDYASCNAGMAHKCGHDGHATILLQLADLVDEACQEGVLTCNVLLIWQPEEETGTGSQKIIEAGILQQYDIRAIYGIHNVPGYPQNEIILTRGTFAAASAGMEIWLKGCQTHASTPENGKNPGLAVARMIENFATFSNASADPQQYKQSTLICVRVGAEAFGTSAGDAYVGFTLRAYSNDTMKQLLSQARQVVKEIAEPQGLQVRVSLREPFNATENHQSQVEVLERVCMLTGRHYTYRATPFRWSEDFANYLMRWPGAMFGVGSGVQHGELHHPDYDFPDDIIGPAAELLLDLVKDFCRNE